MPVYKGNIILGVGTYGWSETYYWNQASHAAAMLLLDALCTLRMAMCKADVEVEILRISDVAIKSDSLLQAATQATGTYAAAGATTFGPDVALQLSGRSADHTAWTHWFLRGLPSDVVDPQDGFHIVGAVPAAFTAALTAFRAAIVANVQLYTKKPNPPGVKNAVAIATTDYRSTLPVRKAGRPFRLPRGRRVIV